MIAGFIHYPLIIIAKNGRIFETIAYKDVEYCFSEIIICKKICFELYIEKSEKKKFNAELKITREGFFCFVLESQFEDAMSRCDMMDGGLGRRKDVITKLMNSLLLFLYYSDDQIINPYEIMVADPHDAITLFLSPNNNPKYFLSPLNRLYGPHNITELDNLEPALTKIFSGNRYVFSINWVESAVDKWACTLEKGADVVDLMSSIMRSVYDCIRHDNLSAVVAGWTVIELLLNKKWSEFLLKNTKTVLQGHNIIIIDTNRRKKFDDNRTYSASVKTEILALSNEINHNMYKSIDTSRKLRNEIAHGKIHFVSFHEASAVVSTAFTFFQTVFQVKFRHLAMDTMS